MRIAILVLLLFAALSASAQSPVETEIKQLEEDAKLTEARKKKADAEAALVDSNRKLLEAKALQDRAGDDAAKAAAGSRGAKKAAELDEDLTELKKLKEVFGDVPKVGREGTMSINATNENQLLGIRAGSIEATAEVARRMCDVMKKGGTTNAFFAPADLDLKVQRTRLFIGELDSVHQLAQSAQESLGGIKSASVTGLMAAMSGARYLLGGIDELSKIFRGDYAVAVANTSRSSLLEALVAGKCPTQVKTVGLESVLRLRVDASIRGKLDAMVSFLVDHEGRAAAAAQETTRYKAELEAAVAKEGLVQAELKKLDAEYAKSAAEKQMKLEDETKTKKPEPQYRKARQALVDQISKANSDVVTLKQQVSGLLDIGKQLKALDPTVSRVKAFLEGVKANSATFAEAVAWSGYDDTKLGLRNLPRISYVLSAQDAQVTVDRAFIGRRLDGMSTVEVVFQVVTEEGDVKAGGAISVTKSRKGLAFAGEDPAPVDETFTR